jgi:branched-chain amino acid transport system ATP-binding protein
MTMMEKSFLQVKNVRVGYGDLQALHGVSLDIPQGAVVSIIGPNGAGKSTLLNTICGICKPTSGEITFKNERIDGLETNKIVRRGISMAPEGSRVFQSMSVMENLLMGAFRSDARKKRVELLDNAFELFPILKKKAEQLTTFLSGGQRQMLAIARALMSDPDIVLCDEISLGIAPIVVKDIYRKIEEVNAAGMTFLLVEQDVKRSLKHSHYAYVMVKGRIVMEGPSDELPEDEVKRAYFGVGNPEAYYSD